MSHSSFLVPGRGWVKAGGPGTIQILPGRGAVATAGAEVPEEIVPFPTGLKPVVNHGYGFARGANVVQTPVQSGLPRSGLDIATEPVPFTITFIVSAAESATFWDFYDDDINHGADSFLISLDSGGSGGNEEHQCIITGPVRATAEQYRIDGFDFDETKHTSYF